MKNIIFSFFVLFSVLLTAQTTHNINWFIGALPGDTNIELGDTVNWIWTDGAPHSVTSDINADIFFDSGILPNGSMFSKLFDEVGISSYFCQVHNSMFGTILVENLGVEDDETISFQYYPNPVKDYLFIDSNDIIDTVKLFDINGRLLMDAPVANKKTTVYMGVFPSGMYFVTVNSGSDRKSFQVVLDR